MLRLQLAAAQPPSLPCGAQRAEGQGHTAHSVRCCAMPLHNSKQVKSQQGISCPERRIIVVSLHFMIVIGPCRISFVCPCMYSYNIHLSRIRMHPYASICLHDAPKCDIHHIPFRTNAEIIKCPNHTMLIVSGSEKSVRIQPKQKTNDSQSATHIQSIEYYLLISQNA